MNRKKYLVLLLVKARDPDIQTTNVVNPSVQDETLATPKGERQRFKQIGWFLEG
jgi:hypothetical protein